MSIYRVPVVITGSAMMKYSNGMDGDYVSGLSRDAEAEARAMPPYLGDVLRGGLLVASTVDRTTNSFAFAIVGAEYVLRVLPRGTHHLRRFVRPQELYRAAHAAGLVQVDLRGMRNLPMLHRAAWVRSTAVNYIAAFARPA